MMRAPTLLLSVSVLLLTLSGPACKPAPEGDVSPEPVAAEATGGAPAAESAYLETPYTAEQIRDAWVHGLTLTMMNETSYGKQYQRWTVVGADADGADIEQVEIDAAGKQIGPPRVERSLWIELRDHARFPADRCTRTLETRQTPLGELEGWVYALRDDANDAVTEFFFARSLPGAPVHMVVRQGGVILQEMTQQERKVIPRS